VCMYVCMYVLFKEVNVVQLRKLQSESLAFIFR
jgi:hypothetical protein